MLREREFHPRSSLRGSPRNPWRTPTHTDAGRSRTVRRAPPGLRSPDPRPVWAAECLLHNRLVQARRPEDLVRPPAGVAVISRVLRLCHVLKVMDHLTYRHEHAAELRVPIYTGRCRECLEEVCARVLVRVLRIVQLAEGARCTWWIPECEIWRQARPRCDA